MLRSQKKHPKNGAEELIITTSSSQHVTLPTNTKGLSQSLKWHLNSNVSKSESRPAVRNKGLFL